MALLNWGSEKRVGITFNAKAKWKLHNYKKEISLPKFTNLETLEALSFKLKLPVCEFLEAERPWNLRIKKLVLSKESRCFYPELFNLEKDLAIIGFCWTYDGSDPEMFPAPAEKESWAFVDFADGNTRKLFNENLLMYDKASPSGQVSSMIFLVELPRNVLSTKRILQKTQDLMDQSLFCESVKTFSKNLSIEFAEKLKGQRQDFVKELKQFFVKQKLDILELFNGFFSTTEVKDDLNLVFREEFLLFEIELKTKKNDLIG